ncbi:response regulator transcription factor [Paenibacillus sp. CF384]|uniref:response regulator transcription factor n=1 Tax=Paenibacillus sp. CF384 TaxID=1884382 RepID=UPI00089A42EB|nr:response regulator transcription factor [Paenibacillus sp. CF384]SDW54855.1 DNA-binding response regulator, OmpR family, contains REC and winged-helix (wHTH) domain [Paenibacillus sp. CF384]
MTNLLIVEDDIIFGDMLSLYLREEGYNVTRVQNASSGIASLQSEPPDLIVLDLILPDTQDANPCILFRQFTTIPIIVISSETKVSMKIHSLTEGADDFICKPFSLQELKARIETVLRRTSPKPVEVDNERMQSDTSIRINLDMDSRHILIHGDMIETTFSEFEIMRLMFHSPGKVFSREALVNSLRGYDSFINERSIDFHVTNLRKKIEENPKQPAIIKTVWGVGYKLIM